MDEISGLVIVKIVGQQRTMYSSAETKAHKKLSITGSYKQYTRDSNIWPKRNDRHFRFGIFRLLQNKTRCTAAKFKQGLSFWISRQGCVRNLTLIVNELKKDKKILDQEKYPWLEDSDERKYMTDRELLDKYIDLGKSCLPDSEKKEVRDMIYKYKDAFSLRDEIGTCWNIGIDIDFTDKTLFFIRPYHVKEKDKRILDKEMKRLCYLGILKEGFSAYLSPVVLISRKVTQDKRIVTDFRYLNTRISKNNLAYPLIKDMFATLGNSKCDVLLVLDLKDAFHSLRLSENLKKYCGILPHFGSASYLYQRMLVGQKCFPTNLAVIYNYNPWTV